MITLRYGAKKLHCGEHVRELGFEHFDSELNNTLSWKHPVERVTMQIDPLKESHNPEASVK